ncbi:hypothetical protein RZS08_24365, partial [Arthrospira platensis SPKY1]|nr:hypothetical protein [Arthrospira platensis SPKY1]
DGSVALFLPNRFTKEHFLYGNDVEHFPDRFTRRVFTLEAKQTEGYSLPSDELFMVVATYEEVFFVDRMKSFAYFSSMLELNKWLVGIPRSERAEAFARFTVRK